MSYDAELKFRLPGDWKNRLEKLGEAQCPQVNASEMGRRAVARFLRLKAANAARSQRTTRAKRTQPQPVV